MADRFHPGSDLSAELIAQRGFAQVWRGYDPEEVKEFLGSVATEVRALRERIESLDAARREAEQRASHPRLDEATLMNAVGEETAAILRTARTAAVDIVAKAEAKAEGMLADAQTEADALRAEARQLADQMRTEAEAFLATRTAEAEAESTRILGDAGTEADRVRQAAHADAAHLRQQAEQERKLTIDGAQAIREKILSDLARRRKVATVQIEQLRAGRERLLDSYLVVRRTLEEVTEELHRADAEARAAAEAVGRQAGADTAEHLLDLRNPTAAEDPFTLPSLTAPPGGAPEPATGETPLVGRGSPSGGASPAAEGSAGSNQAGGGTSTAVVAAPVEARTPSAAKAPMAKSQAGPVLAPAKPAAAKAAKPSPATATAKSSTAAVRSSSGPGTKATSPDVEDFEEVSVLETEGIDRVRILRQPTAPKAQTSTAEPEIVATEPTVAEVETVPDALVAADVEADVAADASVAAAADVAEAGVSGAADVVTTDAAIVAAADVSTDADVPSAVESPAASEPATGLGATGADAAAGTPGSEVAEVQADKGAEVTGGAQAEPGPGTPGVDGLFARIRAGREKAVAQARTTLEAGGPAAAAGASGLGQGSKAVAEGEDSPEATGAGEPVMSDADEAVLQHRDRATDPIESALTRRLKRVLQDEQNALLDRLRGVRGAPTAAAVLPDPFDQRESYAAVGRPALVEAAAAGTASVAALGGPAASSVPEVEDLADELASAICEPLRERLVAVFDRSAGEDVSALTDSLGAAYREWKTQRIEAAAGDQVAAAYARGAYDAWPEGARLRWVAEDLGGPCPDCDDNVLAGSQVKGEEWPTGQLCPPAHPGCRCALAPATSE